LDEATERAGGYVDHNPGRPLVIDADYRAMSKYCTAKGIKPMDLTEEEYGMFLYEEPLVYAVRSEVNSRLEWHSRSPGFDSHRLHPEALEML